MVRVLIVDDEYGLRLLISTALRSSGYGTVEVEGGLEALDMLKRDPQFDVIFSDIRMAKMSGLQLLEELKRTYPALPMELSSAHSGADVIAQVMRLGATAFLPRPFKVQQLQQVSDRAVHRASSL